MTTPPLEFVFAARGVLPPGRAGDVVYVDGTADGFRSLSHWPGNSTPAELKHDLSTGIALRWAGLSAARRDELLGPFGVVTNNHYDTDGALSLFAMLRPDAALPRAEAMLRAAATGDFATWQGPGALAVELTVSALVKHPASPLGSALLAAPDARRWEAGYRWLLAELPSILDEPFRYRHLWAEAHARTEADVAAVEAGDGVDIARRPELDLAVVTTDRPLAAVALHHAAGALYRVLLVRPGDDGFRYRFVYRDESWFEMVSVQPLARAPLAPIVAELQAREQRAGRPGVRADGARWWHDDLEAPVCELGFGAPDREDGFHGERDLSGDPPSRLEPDQVLEVLAAGLSAV